VQPAVSVGNVGQLACDLLISTLNSRRVGYLYDDSTVPVAGSDPFDQHSRHITTAVEGLVSHFYLFYICHIVFLHQFTTLTSHSWLKAYRTFYKSFLQ